MITRKGITQYMGLHSMCCFASFVMLAVVLQMSVYAQPPTPMPGPGMLSPAERAEQLKDELNLTEAQTAKVKLIFEEQHKEMRKQQQQSEDEHMAMREAMMKKRKEVDAKIAALLDEKQKEQFAELQKHRRTRGEEGPGFRGPHPPDRKPHE